MDPAITTTHDNKPTPTPAPILLNGKKHHHHQIKHPHPNRLYRECLKNHAASLGGHAVDGCGEFMPSLTSATCDPSSLTCAACGCHRNFHRRLLDENHQQQVQSSSFSASSSSEEDGEDEDEVGQYGPHMLLALSSGVVPTASGNVGSPAVVGPPGMPTRKRVRSRFSPEQKEKMYELSERLGWRMQRRDDGIIEERCREIGVVRGVFKVWMHNNKHNYVVTAVSTKQDGNANANGGGHGSNGSENASSA